MSNICFLSEAKSKSRSGKPQVRLFVIKNGKPKKIKIPKEHVEIVRSIINEINTPYTLDKTYYFDCIPQYNKLEEHICISSYVK